jgi:DNA-binding transcriptional ArsR family regulator
LRALRAEELVEYRREGKMALYSLTERGLALLDVAGVGDPAASVRG